MKNIEVELKFPLLNPKELIENLNAIAKVEKAGEFQKDTYFIPVHRNFLSSKPIREWLRIRETNKGFSLNYKNWYLNSDGSVAVFCDEFETKVEDGEVLKKLFEALNFMQIVVVEKTRNTWSYKDVLIAIDEVLDLGRFVELEAKGDFATIEEVKSHLYFILKELNANLGPQDFEGYPHLLLKKKGLLS